MPHVVDPPHPPMNMAIRSSVEAKPPHAEKLALPYPVPVMIDTALKLACRIATETGMPSLLRYQIRTTTTDARSARNQRTWGS